MNCKIKLWKHYLILKMKIISGCKLSVYNEKNELKSYIFNGESFVLADEKQ